MAYFDEGAFPRSAMDEYLLRKRLGLAPLQTPELGPPAIPRSAMDEYLLQKQQRGRPVAPLEAAMAEMPPQPGRVFGAASLMGGLAGNLYAQQALDAQKSGREQQLSEQQKQAAERIALARGKMGALLGGTPGNGYGQDVADRYAAAHAPINVPPQQNVDAQWALRSRRYPTMPGDAGPGAAPAGPRTLADIRARAEQLLAGDKYVKTIAGGVRRVDNVADELNGVAKQQAALGQRFGGFATPEERRTDAQKKRAIAQAQREMNAKDPTVALNAAARLRRAGLLDEGDTMSVMQERIDQFRRAGVPLPLATEIVSNHMQQAAQEKYRQESLGLEREKLATAKETAAEERKRLREEAAARREESSLLRALQKDETASRERTAKYVADKGLEGTLSKDMFDTPFARLMAAARLQMDTSDPAIQNAIATGQYTGTGDMNGSGVRAPTPLERALTKSAGNPGALSSEVTRLNMPPSEILKAYEALQADTSMLPVEKRRRLAQLRSLLPTDLEEIGSKGYINPGTGSIVRPDPDGSYMSNFNW
jgi:hypothetical protein